MTALFSLLFASVLVADIGSTLKTVIGVVLALAGLGILLMGCIALADKALQKGGIAFGLGAVLILAGLWMVGAL